MPDDEFPHPENLSIEDYFKTQGVSDFGQISGVAKVELVSKATEDSRIRREERSTTYKHRVNLAIHITGLILIVVLTAICGTLLVQTNSTPKDKEWARVTLSTIASVVGGYVFGRSSKDVL